MSYWAAGAVHRDTRGSVLSIVCMYVCMFSQEVKCVCKLRHHLPSTHLCRFLTGLIKPESVCMYVLYVC